MITMRKSIHGFRFLSYMSMGLRLVALRVPGAPLWCLLLTGPSAPPKSVRAVTRTMYSIGVKWDEVPESFRNGDIMSYTIRYHSSTSARQQQKEVLSPSTLASLTHLANNTNYTISWIVIYPVGRVSWCLNNWCLVFYNSVTALSWAYKWRGLNLRGQIVFHLLVI